MIKYRTTTLLLSYALLGVIPSQGAAINNNPSNGSLEISGNTVMYLPDEDSKKDEDLKNVVQKFNEDFPSKARKEKREATIDSLRNFPLQIIDIIDGYNEEIFHLDLTEAGNLKILKYLNKYAKTHFTAFTFSLSNKIEATLLRNLLNITRLNVKGMVSMKLMENIDWAKLTDFSIDLSAIENIEDIENIENSLDCLDKLLPELIQSGKLNVEVKVSVLIENNYPNKITELKKKGFTFLSKKKGLKINNSIKNLNSDYTVNKETTLMEEIKQLIEKGADVNAKDKFERTPLYYSVRYGYMELTKFLIGEGAEVNAKDFMELSPLHFISKRRLSSLTEEKRIDMAKFLIGEGAEVNAKNEGNRTPLYYSVQDGYMKLTKFLIGEGAKVNEKDREGNSPFDLARKKGNLAMINLLRENDATDNNISLHGVYVNAKDFFDNQTIELPRRSGFFRRIIYFLLFREIF